MRKSLLAATAAVIAMATMAAPVRADTTDDLLKRLLEKGILTQAEYDQLTARKTTEAAATPVAHGATEGVATSASAPTPAQALDSRAVKMTDSGVGLQMGPVAVKLSGSVNGFYVHDSGDSPISSHNVVGGLATAGSDTSAVRNGLIPGFVKIDVTTTQGGFDIGAHFALWPGINSVSGVGGANSAGTPTALATSGIDARQTYLTVARADLGELKIGRDLGLFGGDAILDDFTLLGVGTAAGNSGPSNTSIGRIGVGYIYADFQPQITYTSPKYGGLQAAVGVFQPLVTAGGSEVNGSPGFQGKVSYDFKAESVSGKLWADFISQKHDTATALPSYTGYGFDLGAKVNVGDAALVGYYYNGTGIGTTGLFILATDALGHRRDSNGFYVQGAYTFVKKLTLGVSYGESNLDLASNEVNPTLLKTNSSYIFQSRYALTSWFSLVGEYTHTKSQSHSSNQAESDAIALGGILFF